MGAERPHAARVPTRPLRRPHLPAGRRRRAQRHQHPHRTHVLEPSAGDALGILARRGGKHCLRHRAHPPRQRQREGGGTQLHQRRHPLVTQPVKPQRVLTAAGPRHAVLWLPERDRLCAQRAHWRRAVDIPRPRRRQGQPIAVRRSALLRRLFGPPAGDLRADRPAPVDQRLGRRPARQRYLLLDRRRRLRPRLPGQHRRARLRLRRLHGEARLGRADRCLRIRLAGHHQRTRPRTQHLSRLLQRHLLCAQRPLRSDRVEVQRARAHLRLGHNHRAHRLLRRPRPAQHIWPRHLHRPRQLREEHRRL